MTTSDKHEFLRKAYFNDLDSGYFGHFIDLNDPSGKILELYKKSQFNLMEIHCDYKPEQVLLINLLYKIIKDKNEQDNR
jgi:hypothetical protein